MATKRLYTNKRPSRQWYHGCRMDVAQRLLRGDATFQHSENAYDWLGNGVYFWEAAPIRAMEWATKRFEHEAAVICADVDLGVCLNLLDTQHFSGLEAAYLTAVEELGHAGVELPKNKGKQHYLDRMVVEFFCQDYARVSGIAFQTVRGCFPEGLPVYPGSRIRRETHIQIAVRDTNCISKISLVE